MLLSDFRPIFLYEFKLNQSGAETAQKINQTFGNDSVNERTIRRWFAKFRSGHFSLNSPGHGGDCGDVVMTCRSFPRSPVPGAAEIERSRCPRVLYDRRRPA
ncbi:unnamed protein product [Euphydryas editha]|uniref:Mos1 transposase HTH domain-containing protein n=1 Tax=Euphydryas editha TaxID=104508 RepID=A0AAU9TE70_EUPED|nr:unnamed protein product [Euphydryas editha]